MHCIKKMRRDRSKGKGGGNVSRIKEGILIKEKIIYSVTGIKKSSSYFRVFWSSLYAMPDLQPHP